MSLKFPTPRLPGLRSLVIGSYSILLHSPIAQATPVFEPIQAFVRSPETPRAKLIQASDGNFYGTTSAGGSGGVGTVFKMTAAGAVTTLVNFAGANGSSPSAGLVQGSDGNFYGTTSSGGSSNYGTVFKMSAAGALTTLVNFAGANGLSPQAGLIQGSDGDFYGTTSSGGSNNYNGTVFKMTPAGDLTTLVNFDDYNNGENPYAALLQGSDGNFYGTTSSGGSGGRGTIFKMTAAGDLTTLVNFAGGGGGSDPIGALIQDNAGNFYGTTAAGGWDNFGTVFKMTPAGYLTTLGITVAPQSGLVLGDDGNFYATEFNGIIQMTPAGVRTTLMNFTGSNGSIPRGGLIVGSDGNFYGTTSAGGSGANGTAFKMTPAGALTNLVNFGSPKGRDLRAGLVQGSDGNFYGTTSAGGSDGVGTVFKMTAAGAETTLVSFPSNGGGPFGGPFSPIPSGLIQGSEGDFYGTISRGGSGGGSSGGGGTVFKMTTAGSVTTLVNFTGSNGETPLGGLLRGSDGDFYGITSRGGSGDRGTIFKMTAAGSVTTLVNFGRDGTPSAGLMQGSDGNFYGTTKGNGAFYDNVDGTYGYDSGTIFKMNPSGDLTTLVNFPSGSNPSRLIQGSDGNFYGTTSAGGSGGSGTVFQMTPTGDLTALANFSGANGSTPTAGLLQGSDGNFYGTTITGGGNGYGTVFQMTAAGDLTTLVNFTSANGSTPSAALVRGSDGHLYGTTRSGGTTADGQPAGGGQIFRLRMGPAVTTTAASPVTLSNIQLNATVNPGGYSTSVAFRYGISPSLDTYSTISAGTLSAGIAPVSAQASLTGLPANTVYYYRVVASNAENTVLQSGEILSFTTPNHSPVFSGYTASTPYQTTATLAFAKLLAKAADADGDALSISSVGASAHGGTVTMQATSLTYAPPSGFSGTDTFGVTILDAHGATVAGSVTMDVKESSTAGGLGMNPVTLKVLPGGHMGIAFQGIPARTYLVQRSTDLTGWQTLATLVADSTGMISYTDESPPTGSAFYRLGKP